MESPKWESPVRESLKGEYHVSKMEISGAEANQLRITGAEAEKMGIPREPKLANWGNPVPKKMHGDTRGGVFEL